MVIGVNPSVEITTLVVIALAWIFSLNQVASQIGTHVLAPFHLLLFVLFVEVASIFSAYATCRSTPHRSTTPRRKIKARPG
nr:hypothetical protein [Terriglobus roseus]